MARAQSLSINTLIIAALGVLVLIIASMMIYKYMNDEPISACSNLGGSCVPTQDCDEPTEGQRPLLGDESCEQGTICCLTAQS